MDELTRVRNEIDRIDEEIIRLLKSRYELAKQLGRIKKTRGISIRDSQREQVILRDVQNMASANGLPWGPIRQVFLQVFGMAISAQSHPTIRQDLRGLVVLIAGGTGRMGRLFANIAANHGASVKIFGRTASKNLEIAKEIGVLPSNYSDARQADIVFVSVPIQATSKVSLKLTSIMKPDSLVADLSSVKTGIADKIAKGTGRFEYVSLHPLFGPDVAHIGGQEIAAIPFRTGPLWKRLRRVFAEEGATVHLTTSGEHDMTMARIQALHHFALICLGMTMKGTSGAITTRSLRITEAQIRRLYENWDTIIAIQRLNPYAARERQEFRKTVNRIATMGPAESRRALRVLTEYVQKWSRKQ